MLVVRDATIADVPVLCRFNHDLAVHEGEAHLVTATEAEFRDALFAPRPIAGALIAESDGQGVGSALWSHRFRAFSATEVMHVTTVFVVESARRQGVGRALFAELARRALARRCTAVEWGAHASNDVALAFYRSLGAEARTGGVRLVLTGDALATTSALH
jgi:GNAT superfamily N-acetyltransferase